jgi:HAD superfamily hydrolase (TIGR01450 family)
MIYSIENEAVLLTLKRKNVFLFDMDGTIYIDDRVINGAVEFLNLIKKNGCERFFFTNNSSKTREEYYHKLKGFGINTSTDEIITSNRITAAYLKKHYPNARILYMGNYEAASEIKDFGLNIIPPYKRFLDKKIDVAVLAYDTGINYEKISVFSYFLKQNIPYIATHPDINYPSNIGLIPDVGAFIAMFERSTGRTPDQILGKPSTVILDYVFQENNINRKDAVFFGDRLYTDIKMANDSNVSSVLVLSGESQIEDVEKYPYSPDLIVDSLLDLYQLYKGENQNE